MAPSEEAAQGAAVRGRPFPKGNGGRKPGSKNRSSLLAAELVQGEALAMLRTAIQLAKDGNVTMLKFVLGRWLRERPIEFELPPINNADDAVAALSAIASAIAEGAMTPSEGAALTTVVDSTAQAVELADVTKRLDLLEARFKCEIVL